MSKLKKLHKRLESQRARQGCYEAFILLVQSIALFNSLRYLIYSRPCIRRMAWSRMQITNDRLQESHFHVLSSLQKDSQTNGFLGRPSLGPRSKSRQASLDSISSESSSGSSGSFSSISTLSRVSSPETWLDDDSPASYGHPLTAGYFGGTPRSQPIWRPDWKERLWYKYACVLGFTVLEPVSRPCSRCKSKLPAECMSFSGSLSQFVRSFYRKV